ncbi:hypothetical protein B0I35DRAFT_440366 [Stachybotrys elegans]|uniref:Uncharacterized protein n=1 Tax=Stachybotrys elegans TaxID=80388 RepID=A0A8K0WN23_9HYPO|nr:hypothetical protein B0I35DRAFT_440366 [Stachybotrys elegans]
MKGRKRARLPWVPKPSLPVDDTADLPKLMGFRGAECRGPPMLAPDSIQSFLQSASSLSKTGHELDMLCRRHQIDNPLYALLMAIDPTSGSSMLHAVVDAGNIEGLCGIRTAFGPNLLTRQGTYRLVQVFMTHQDKVGNNAMHRAVQTGRLDMVRDLYRFFCLRPMQDERQGAPPDDPSAPENWVFTDEVWHMATRPLLFLCAKNRAGRDVVEEARIRGQEEITQFLERIVKGLDPNLRRTREGEMERMERGLRRNFHFLGSDGKEVEDSDSGIYAEDTQEGGGQDS